MILKKQRNAGVMDIIGAGKVGSCFAVELSAAGYEVRFLTERNKSRTGRIKRNVKGLITSSEINAQAIEESDIVLICVQDKGISLAVDEIKATGADIKGKLFIHTSGALSSEVFKKLKAGVKNTASFHPIQTFREISYKDNSLLRNIYFGIEGGSEAKKFLVKLVKSLKSKYIEIPKNKKYLYHSASVIASNFLVTYMDIISGILKSAGIKKGDAFEIYKPIIMQTLKNIEESGSIDSLTGPIERNDTELLSRQIESIAVEMPQLLEFYLNMSNETSKVALKKKSLTKEEFNKLNKIINEYKVTG